MSFLSPRFFLFFPIVILIYFLLPRKGQNIWLLAASWIFYVFTKPVYLAFLAGTVTLTYFGARLMNARQGRCRRALLVSLLVILFGALFLFKYLGFAFSLSERALSCAGLHFTSPALEIILPAGISFYLFMAAGYLIDVYRGRGAEKNFVHLSLFLSFFPSLLSGPINRADDLLPQLKKRRTFDYPDLRAGLLRFLWGAFKKLVIADRLGILVTTVYSAPASFGSLQVAAAACAFSLQIYCDFSAYSDMALGLSSALGIRLTENFRTPYFSRSIAEFWRRWHISLSSWFRDYLYIPLGGSRKGKARKYINVLIVFAVSGLWHGSALTFLAWGLLNGVYQIIGSASAPVRLRCRRLLHLKDESRLTLLWQVFVTFLLSTLAWVFFKANSLSHAFSIFKAMLTAPYLTLPISSLGLDPAELAAAAAALAVLLAADLYSLGCDPFRRCLDLPRPLRWAVSLALILAVFIFGVYGTGYDAQDFIYFKF